MAVLRNCILDYLILTLVILLASACAPGPGSPGGTWPKKPPTATVPGPAKTATVPAPAKAPPVHPETAVNPSVHECKGHIEKALKEFITHKSPAEVAHPPAPAEPSDEDDDTQEDQKSDEEPASVEGTGEDTGEDEDESAEQADHPGGKSEEESEEAAGDKDKDEDESKEGEQGESKEDDDDKSDEKAESGDADESKEDDDKSDEKAESGDADESKEEGSAEDSQAAREGETEEESGETKEAGESGEDKDEESGEVKGEESGEATGEEDSGEAKDDESEEEKGTTEDSKEDDEDKSGEKEEDEDGSEEGAAAAAGGGSEEESEEGEGKSDEKEESGDASAATEEEETEEAKEFEEETVEDKKSEEEKESGEATEEKESEEEKESGEATEEKDTEEEKESGEAESVEEGKSEADEESAEKKSTEEEHEDKDEESAEADTEEDKSGEEAEGEGETESDQEGGSEETEEEEEEETEPVELRSRVHIDQILALDDESMANTIAAEKSVQNTLKELKKMYDQAVKPMEVLYKFKDISNRFVGDAEIFSKPLILFIGPWSSGKSAMINYLLDIEDTRAAMKTGAEPQSNGFTVLMYGETEQTLDGIELAADWTFSTLQKFGQSFLDRLQGRRLPNNLLRKVTIVDTPGIMENRKQQERIYPFNDACQWLIDRADIIYVVFDPTKLDMGLEMEALFDQLKGREAQVRVVLNKADSISPQELMQVQSTLLWNLSPLLGSSEPPTIFVGSFWSREYLPGSPATLFDAQEAALLQDLRQTIDGRVENKISFTRRHAVRVRNHAKMVDCYLNTYYNHKTFFSNKKKVADEIIDNPQNYHIYEGLSTLTNVSRYDLPDPDIYRDFFKVNPLYDFKLLTSTCSYFKGCPLDKLDLAIAYDLPELMGKYRKLIGSSIVGKR